MLVLVAVLLAVSVSACDNSPSEPIPGWVFEGDLAQGEIDQHLFFMPEADVVRMTLVDVRQRFPPLDEGLEPPVLGVALGRLDEDGVCIVTLPLPARIGGTILVSLNEREYCVRVGDPGTLAEDVVVEYTVSVDPQD